MYEFLRGPMLWISSIICVTGLLYQLLQLFRLTRGREQVYYAVVEKAKDKTVKEKIKRIFSSAVAGIISLPSRTNGTIIKNQPALAAASFVFHFCLLVTPVFLVGHNILFFESWGFNICSFPEAVSDALTVILILSGLIYLARRIFVPSVRAVTGLRDYILLFISIAPFLSGFLAYHQLFEYKSVILVHFITGELMLIAMGVTRLSHMIFFFFARFFIASEYSLGSGSRSWYR